MNSRFKIALFCAGTLLLLSASFIEASAAKYGSSQSQSNLGFKGWGPRLGFVDPEGALDGTAEIGVVFDFGEFIPQLRWDGSVSFWSTGRNYRYYDGHQDKYYDWTVRDFILRTGVNYMFLVGEWVPYVGGGLAMHFYSWDYNHAPHLSNSSDSEIGIYIDLGIEHEFSSNWTGQVQLQSDFVSPDQSALLFNLIYRIR